MNDAWGFNLIAFAYTCQGQDDIFMEDVYTKLTSITRHEWSFIRSEIIDSGGYLLKPMLEMSR